MWEEIPAQFQANHTPSQHPQAALHGPQRPPQAPTIFISFECSLNVWEEIPAPFKPHSPQPLSPTPNPNSSQPAPQPRPRPPGPDSPPSPPGPAHQSQSSPARMRNQKSKTKLSLKTCVQNFRSKPWTQTPYIFYKPNTMTL